MAKSSRDDRIDSALVYGHRRLQEEAAKACPHTAVADGVMSGLLSLLAEVCLTPHEQAQVKQIIALHQQCHYPLASQ